jgi:protein-disulfide isomerase
MSDQSQNGAPDPNAPEAPKDTGAQQAVQGAAKPFYMRPPFLGGAAVAIVVIIAAAFLIGPSGDPASSPEAKAETAVPANDVAKASGWDLGRPGDIVMGSPDAPVKLVEYASLTCGHCAYFKLTVFPDIKKKYIDSGLVQYTLREFPTPPVGLATAGFMLARCAGEERYYPALEALFRTQPLWIKPDPQEARAQLEKISRQFGLNETEFETCINDEAELTRIRSVQEAGNEKFGINATPSFVINGRKADIRGASFEALDSAIRDALPEGAQVPEYTPAGAEGLAADPDDAGDEPADDASDEDGSGDGASDEGASDDEPADEGASEGGASGDEAEDEGASDDGASGEDDADAEDGAGDSGGDDGAEDGAPQE